MIWALALAVLAGGPHPQDKKPSESQKILKGKTSLLRAMRKDFASYLGVAGEGAVRLRLEKDAQEIELRLAPDAEIRIRGSWGRLEDLEKGGRVWIWRTQDRDKKPREIVFLADEVTEQAMHGVPYTVKSAEAGKVVVHRVLGRKKARQESTRTLTVSETVDAGALQENAGVYFQSAGDRITFAIDEEKLDAVRRGQRERLEERWRKEGLPGTVAFVHSISGEAEVLLDHETMRWARALKEGAVVQVNGEKPIRALLQSVRGYRERTRVTLVSPGRELSGLQPGRRVRLGVEPPSAEAIASKFPPDMGKVAGREDRIAWVLSSIYCACSIGGDG